MDKIDNALYNHWCVTKRSMFFISYFLGRWWKPFFLLFLFLFYFCFLDRWWWHVRCFFLVFFLLFSCYVCLDTWKSFLFFCFFIWMFTGAFQNLFEISGVGVIHIWSGRCWKKTDLSHIRNLLIHFLIVVPCCTPPPLLLVLAFPFQMPPFCKLCKFKINIHSQQQDHTNINLSMYFHPATK